MTAVAIVLLTHEGLAEALLKTASQVEGRDFERLAALSVAHFEPLAGVRSRLQRILSSLGDGPALILTDQMGSTPTNVATRVQAERGAAVEVITGLNLPMLLKVLHLRRDGEDVATLAQAALSGGRENITRVTPPNRPLNTGAETASPGCGHGDCPPSDSGDCLGDARREVEVSNRLGLHASASAKLVRLASKFESEVFIRLGQREVNAKSILGVLTLAAARGSVIMVRAVGPDARAAVEAVVDLCNRKFDEGA